MLVIKQSYIARAEQQNTQFMLHLRDAAFRQMPMTIKAGEFVVVISADRFPTLHVLTSSGYVGYVGAIFFEHVET